MADKALDPVRTPSPCKPLDDPVESFNQVATTPIPCSLPHCPPSMYTCIFPPECDQCVTDCDMTSCDADATQCTYRCAVVSCTDPSSCADACQDCPSYDLECDAEGCPFSADELHQSSGTSYGAAFAYVSPASGSANSLSWSTVGSKDDSSLDAVAHVFGSISQDSGLSSSTQSAYPPTQNASYNQYTSFSKASPVSNLFSPILASTESSQSSPSLTSSALTPLHYPTSDVQGPVDQTAGFLEPSVTSCLWIGCGKQFHSIQKLSEHVNSVHLNFQRLHEQHSQSQEIRPQDISEFIDNFSCPESVRCHWANCAEDPFLQSFDQSAIENPGVVKEVLMQHVQQAHLGFTVESMNAQMTVPSPPKPIAPNGLIHSASPTVSGPKSFLQRSKVKEIATEERSDGAACHCCKWQACLMAGVPFWSAAELTQHISDNHVGTGFSRYHCWWEGCNRNNDYGFSSKQKILRHIQSHTGHRPFKCPECNQFFSEAATLQQHIRRHTKEKPYVCDFPGCSKAFAIAGALTIHKRVHSGSKPFKCQFCDRSFAESSNLSKHVRTHTGDRPYACPYPGCDKKFARPDQVTRHKNVHVKEERML